MATPTKTVPTEPTGALFRALRSVNVEPNLAYEAAEENRRRAGENVVTAIGAQIAELKAEMKAGFSEVNSRIDTLEKVVWRVIWPLIVLLAVPVFGLLYRVLTTALVRRGLQFFQQPRPAVAAYVRRSQLNFCDGLAAG